jgi:hypothetical protein
MIIFFSIFIDGYGRFGTNYDQPSFSLTFQKICLALSLHLILMMKIIYLIISVVFRTIGLQTP